MEASSSESSDSTVAGGGDEDCVVISDDDTESNETAQYHVPKRARRSENTEEEVVMIRENSASSVRDSNSEEDVVMVTESPPGPSSSSRLENVVMVAHPTTDTISITDDDEPIITNVIDREDRRQPITWQFVQRTSPTEGGIRRNAHSVTRYRARRPTARRAIRSREYGNFVNTVREMSGEVIVSPLSRVVDSSTARIRSYNRIQDGAYQDVEESSNSRSITNSNIHEDRVTLRRGVEATGRALVAREELLHMTSLRDRITTLRRDLQNLNGLLTDSFELLHRIAPAPNSPLVDKTVLDRAPTKLANESDVSRERKCSICLGHYKAGDTLRVLPCEHEFHDTCIDRWLTTCSGKCPFCRADVQEALT